MKITFNVTVDVEPDAYASCVHDMANHIASVLTRRVEVRRVDVDTTMPIIRENYPVGWRHGQG